MADSPKRLTLSQLKKPIFVPTPPTVDFTSGGAGVDVSYSMTGMQSLIDNIGKLPKVYQDAAGVEMTSILSDIYDDSRENYVPYRFGDLRDSADFDEYEPGMGVQMVEMSIWYGGPPLSGAGAAGSGPASTIKSSQAAQEGLHTVDPSVYALLQHEDLSFLHPIEGVVTAPQAKYLEKPFLAGTADVESRLAKAITDIGGPDVSVQATASEGDL